MLSGSPVPGAVSRQVPPPKADQCLSRWISGSGGKGINTLLCQPSRALKRCLLASIERREVADLGWRRSVLEVREDALDIDEIGSPSDDLRLDECHAIDGFVDLLRGEMGGIRVHIEVLTGH